MRSADFRDPPELIPYASHVAHGTGRTPIGIILFAASHLLLGGVIAFAILRVLPRVGASDFELQLFALAVTLASLTMMFGGVMLLMKGQIAWACSAIAFACLAACETLVAAMGIFRWYDSPSFARYDFSYFMRQGGGLAVTATSLFMLCIVVLRYLGSAKARNTFALPPGETSLVMRWFPRVALLVFPVALLIGRGLGLMIAP